MHSCSVEGVSERIEWGLTCLLWTKQSENCSDIWYADIFLKRRRELDPFLCDKSDKNREKLGTRDPWGPPRYFCDYGFVLTSLNAAILVFDAWKPPLSLYIEVFRCFHACPFWQVSTVWIITCLWSYVTLLRYTKASFVPGGSRECVGICWNVGRRVCPIIIFAIPVTRECSVECVRSHMCLCLSVRPSVCLSVCL